MQDPDYRERFNKKDRERKREYGLRKKYLTAKIEEQGGICGICKNPLPAKRSEIHLDHILPRIRGGSDDPHNLQAACAACNLRKGGRV